MRKAAYCSQKVSENGTNYYLIDHIVSLNKNSETFVLWQANKLIEKGQGHRREVKQHKYVKLGHTHLMFLYQSISQLFLKFQITRQIQV